MHETIKCCQETDIQARANQLNQMLPRNRYTGTRQSNAAKKQIFGHEPINSIKCCQETDIQARNNELAGQFYQLIGFDDLIIDGPGVHDIGVDAEAINDDLLDHLIIDDLGTHMKNMCVEVIVSPRIN